MPAPKVSALPVPHSWTPPDWPLHVYPGTERKGRYIIQQHREELVRLGALTRVGRDLVVIGRPYAAWVQTQGHRVVGFEIAPNKQPEDTPDQQPEDTT